MKRSLTILWLVACSGWAGAAGQTTPRWLDAAELAEALSDWQRPTVVVDLQRQRPTLKGAQPLLGTAGAWRWDGVGSRLLLIRDDQAHSASVERWIDAFRAAGLEVLQTLRDPSAWQRQGLQVTAVEAPTATPKQFPFVIPVGICELDEPAIQLRPEHFSADHGSE